MHVKRWLLAFKMAIVVMNAFIVLLCQCLTTPESRVNVLCERSMAVFFFVADSLFKVTPIGLWGFCVWSLFCYALLSDLSSFKIILGRKVELVDLL